MSKTNTNENAARVTGQMKSFKPQVIADSTGEWIDNALRFATREEAEAQVSELAMRWTAVRETRVVESEDPVNYAYKDGELVKADEEAAKES